MTPFMSLCAPYSDLGDICLSKKQHGCDECADGYYLEKGHCVKCKEGCKTCDNGMKCTACIDDYVKDIHLTQFVCRNIKEVEFCVKAKDSNCIECSNKYILSDDKTECTPPSRIAEIVGSIVRGLAVALIIIIVLVILIVVLIEKRRRFMKFRNVTIFDMRKYNMDFDYKINEDLHANKMQLTFDEGEAKYIPVGEETKDIICIGNNINDMMKVQFTTKENTDRYEIRTNPQIIILKRHEACEFEVYIKPLCTTSMEDTIKLVTINMKKGVETSNDVKISFTTQLSTKLDPDELIEDEFIADGNFGTLYRGTFRGQKVCIKKMKNLENEGDQQKMMEEFDREVGMLDKIRSIYVVTFIGAVYLVKKLAIVTELAEYGSIRHMIETRKENPVSKALRVKFMFDATKGIQYLHQNGILHRNIKPGNLLVLSLQETGTINAKLTDFGSSRSINLMMTNMTFTKGVGSPKYMAPEVLNREHYKDPADIFSLAITMYEIIGWQKAYP